MLRSDEESRDSGNGPVCLGPRYKRDRAPARHTRAHECPFQALDVTCQVPRGSGHWLQAERVPGAQGEATTRHGSRQPTRRPSLWRLLSP